MNYGRDSFWFDDEMLSSVSRYEEMLKNHTRHFFDVHEFEDIIDYYLDSENFTEAATAANYAARIYPRALSIQLRMAEILIDKGQPVKALSILNKIELRKCVNALPLIGGNARATVQRDNEVKK